MISSLSSENINYEEFQRYLPLYDQHLPAKFEGLEKLRLEEIPEVLEARSASGDAFLEKTEIQALMEWKLWLLAWLFRLEEDQVGGRWLTVDNVQQTWDIPTQSCKADSRKQPGRGP